MKVLLFKLGAFGDVMMTTPLIKALGDKYDVDYLVGKSAAPAIKNNKYINEVKTFDENIFYKKKLFKLIKLIKEIKKGKYSAIYVLDKHPIFSLVAKLTGIKYIAGFSRGKPNKLLNYSIPYDNKKHEIEYYLSLYQPFSNTSLEKSLDYFLPEKKVGYLTIPEKYVCIAVGGGKNAGESKPIRRVPVDIYSEIISKLNVPVVLIGSEDDKLVAATLEERHKDKVINLTGRTDWDLTAFIMSRSNAVFCGDSGPMHLASAVANNIISIFGPTNPARKAPLITDKNHKRISYWKDQDVYESEYELNGKKPSDKIWFLDINVDKIMEDYYENMDN